MIATSGVEVRKACSHTAHDETGITFCKAIWRYGPKTSKSIFTYDQ